MKCPHCGADVEDTFLFCENCGASLAEARAAADSGKSNEQSENDDWFSMPVDFFGSGNAPANPGVTETIKQKKKMKKKDVPNGGNDKNVSVETNEPYTVPSDAPFSPPPGELPETPEPGKFTPTPDDGELKQATFDDDKKIAPVPAKKNGSGNGKKVAVLIVVLVLLFGGAFAGGMYLTREKGINIKDAVSGIVNPSNDEQSGYDSEKPVQENNEKPEPVKLNERMAAGSNFVLTHDETGQYDQSDVDEMNSCLADFAYDYNVNVLVLLSEKSYSDTDVTSFVYDNNDGGDAVIIVIDVYGEMYVSGSGYPSYVFYGDRADNILSQINSSQQDLNRVSQLLDILTAYFNDAERKLRPYSNGGLSVEDAYYRVDVGNSTLMLRADPWKKGSYSDAGHNILASLPNNAVLYVYYVHDGWGYVEYVDKTANNKLITGWTSMDYMRLY